MEGKQVNKQMQSREVWVAQKGTLQKWEFPLRELKPLQICVRVRAVAVDPTDVKHVDGHWADGCGQGTSFSGVVEAVGPGVNGIAVGDAVLGGADGGNVDANEDGAFANLVVISSLAVLRVPEKLSWSDKEIVPAGPLRTWEQAASVCFDLVIAIVAQGSDNVSGLDSSTKLHDNLSPDVVNRAFASRSTEGPLTESELTYYWLRQPSKKMGTTLAPSPAYLNGKMPRVFAAISQFLSAGNLEIPAIHVLRGFSSLPEALDLVRKGSSKKVVVAFN